MKSLTNHIVYDITCGTELYYESLGGSAAEFTDVDYHCGSGCRLLYGRDLIRWDLDKWQYDRYFVKQFGKNWIFA